MASARNSLSKNELLPVYERRSQHDGDISGSVTSFASTIGNNASAAVLAYCLSSISMTLVNKYVVSGASWNLSFLYLAMQVCFFLLYSASLGWGRTSSSLPCTHWACAG
jgi:GDP-mannose transporter